MFYALAARHSVTVIQSHHNSQRFLLTGSLDYLKSLLSATVAEVEHHA